MYESHDLSRKMSTKYTFLIPAYKDKYLKESIDSILSQTYSHFNIILSNDKSPENIEKIISTYNNGKISYRCNKSNIGGKNLTEHWNLILNLCNSQYLIMASDDDVYSPFFLEEIDKLVTKYPEASVFRARTQRINEQGETTSQEDIFEEYQDLVSAMHSMFCGNYIGCIGNYVFNCNALKKVGGFFDLPYAWFSDIVTIITLLKKGQANTNKILFSFRLSEKNISNTKQNKVIDLYKLQATIKFDKWISNYISHLPTANDVLTKRYLTEIISNCKHRVYGQCGDYSWSITPFKWYQYIYKQLKKHTYFSSKSFLKYFLISVLNRISR